MPATTISAALVSGNLEDIISIISANPVYDTVYQLSEAFIELSQKNPEKTEVFASVLLAARNSGNVSKINAGDPVDSAPEYVAFDGLLNRCLFNILSYVLQEPEAIQPSNDYIIACVISGTVIRTGLSFSSVQIGEITRGLHFAETEYKLYLVPEKYEINAVGACMHLVAAGKEVYKGGLIENRAEGESRRDWELYQGSGRHKDTRGQSLKRYHIPKNTHLSRPGRAIASTERLQRASIYRRPMENSVSVIAYKSGNVIHLCEIITLESRINDLFD